MIVIAVVDDTNMWGNFSQIQSNTTRAEHVEYAGELGLLKATYEFGGSPEKYQIC